MRTRLLGALNGAAGVRRALNRVKPPKMTHDRAPRQKRRRRKARVVGGEKPSYGNGMMRGDDG